ncbi:unnamed protein product [Boreogadus saida]
MGLPPAIVDLTDSVANLSDGQKAEARLATFQTEAEIREQRARRPAKDRVFGAEGSGEAPADARTDCRSWSRNLRKKMAHAHEVYNQAKHALTSSASRGSGWRTWPLR